MDGLIAENISKTYTGTHGLSFSALRNVSIRLEPGSFTSLVGESGSGKSTLARLLVGLEPPDQGTIFLDGEDTSSWSTEDWRKRRTKLQAVFQDASGTLNPMRSVRSNVEEAMVNLTSLSKRQRRERIGELMELTPHGRTAFGDSRPAAIWRGATEALFGAGHVHPSQVPYFR